MQRDRPSKPNILINPSHERVAELLVHKAGGAALFCMMEDGSPAALPSLGECSMVVARTYRNGRSSEPEVIEMRGLEGGARGEAIRAGLSAAWMRLEMESLLDERNF